ncbi:hypothetical protein MACH05_18200 [Qipengyuania nanhaisediminis]
MLPGSQDQLAIAISPDLRAFAFEFAAQFAEIVDLAVEDEHCPAIGGVHGLGRADRVDHGQSPVSQPYTVRGPNARPVGPAMREGIAHSLDP